MHKLLPLQHNMVSLVLHALVGGVRNFSFFSCMTAFGQVRAPGAAPTNVLIQQKHRTVCSKGDLRVIFSGNADQ